jgi:hypothetical protein
MQILPITNSTLGTSPQATKVLQPGIFWCRVVLHHPHANSLFGQPLAGVMLALALPLRRRFRRGKRKKEKKEKGKAG